MINLYKFSSWIITIAVVSIATSLIPNLSFAQEGLAIEEITVTARKKDETILETPLAVTALSAQDIKDSAFQNILDIQKSTPGFFIEAINNTNARVMAMPRFRGVTFDTTSPLARTGSVFIDGVLVTGGLHSLPVSNAERVEIIKGPQSAVFGRNTYSGAINIITSTPGDELKGGFDLDYGEKSKTNMSGYIEGPLGDIVSARINLSYSDKEGHYDNAVVEGQRMGDEESMAVNALIDFHPSDNVNIRIRAGHYEDDDGPGAYAVAGGLAEHNYCAGVCYWDVDAKNWSFYRGPVTLLESVFKGKISTPDSIGASTSAELFAKAMSHLTNADGSWTGTNGANSTDGYYPIGSLDFNDLSHNGYGLAREGDRVSISISIDISDSMNLSMTYGDNEDEFLAFTDFDASGTFGFHTANARITTDESFEARLSGSNENFDWSVGFNEAEIMTKFHGGFFDDQIFYNYWFADIKQPGIAAAMTSADTSGLFASIDYHVNDQISITAELRRQEDKVDEPSVNVISPGLSPGSFKKTLPRVSIKNQLSDDAMTYFTYSEGNLPGGFNPEVASKLRNAGQVTEFETQNPGIGQTFNEESLTNYEFGYKKTALDGRLAYNVALFHMERTDQVYSGFGTITADGICNAGSETVPTCTVAFSGNGQSSDIDGFELDVTYLVSENLELRTSLAYVDASISKFPDGAGCGDVQVVFGNCDNVKGSEAPRYPKWQGSLIASYETASNLYIRGELFYNGGYYDEVTNLAEIPSATEINLRLGKRMDNITAELYVTNLTDEDAPLAGNNIADTSGYVRTNSYGYNFTSESVHLALRDKREFGVRFMYEF
jgi:iron complex outermembrane receptor protein